nr:MAG TPA: hypothetical protein [Caudoviricetes sp.]
MALFFNREGSFFLFCIFSFCIFKKKKKIQRTKREHLVTIFYNFVKSYNFAINAI